MVELRLHVQDPVRLRLHEEVQQGPVRLPGLVDLLGTVEDQAHPQVEELLAERSLRLEEIDAFLVRNTGNAEAHLERAKVLRVLKFGSSIPIDAAREAVRLDPSPGKYWVPALAHHDADEVEERDRMIAAGRSLGTESSELADLWQRSSYREAFDFSSTAERVSCHEASDEEALAHQACVRRALRITPESQAEEDLRLREADIRVTGIVGDQPAWFLGVVAA